MFVRFLQHHSMLRNVDLVLEDSHSIPSEADVRSVKEVERRKLRCIFSRMSMLNVSRVAEVDITMKPFKYNSSERISQKFSI